MKVEITGIDKVKRQLQDFQKQAEEAAKPEDVSLSDLMPPAFMEQYTEYSTIDQMAEAYGGIESAEDINSDEWSAFVAEHSQFSGWTEMMQTAGQLRIKKEMGL